MTGLRVNYMAIITDITLPQELAEELHSTIERIPAQALVDLAVLDSSFARGIRAIPANAPKLRERMRALADAPSMMPKNALDTLRSNSFSQSFTCVLSTLALTRGFEAIAAFAGGARLLVSMLLDTREEVVDKAIGVIKSDRPITPQPQSAEAARKAMQGTFEPFLDEMSDILLAPEPPPPPKPEKATTQEGRACDLSRIRELEAAIAKLERQTAALHRKLESERERAASSHAAQAASEKIAAALRSEANASHAEINSLKTKAATSQSHLEKALADMDAAKEAKAATQQRLNAAKARLAEAEAASAALKHGLAAANMRIAELEESNAATVRDVFAKEVEKSIPIAPVSVHPRTILSELIQRPVKAGDRPVFLVDGHNVINTVQRYVVAGAGGMPHEDLRKTLMKDAAALQRKLAPCEMRVFFDGSIPTEHVMPGNTNVREVYSGGTGDHRADNRIAAYCVFLSMQKGAAAIVVTDDADLRDEAGKSSALLLHTADFIGLM